MLKNEPLTLANDYKLPYLYIFNNPTLYLIASMIVVCMYMDANNTGNQPLSESDIDKRGFMIHWQYY